MNRVLILGAGAVKAAATSRPTARQPPLDADFFQIASRLARTRFEKVHSRLQDMVGDYSATVMKSLETTTTYLYLKAIDSKPSGPEHVAFLDHLRLLYQVLRITTNPIRVGPRSSLYRLLRRELAAARVPERVTIITFNYDLVLERVLDSIAAHSRSGVFLAPGCYRLPGPVRTIGVSDTPKFMSRGRAPKGVALLKLHGSMNWQSAHKSKRPSPSALFNIRRELTVLDSSQLSDSLTWRRKRRTVYLRPIIIPPVSGKRGMMHRSLGTVWQLAATALEEASRVVVLGYSCPPLDVEARMLLSEHMRKGAPKTLTVIDPKAEVAARFQDVCGTKDMRIFSSLKAFLGS